MTKDHILQIATQQFAKYGYDGVSMNKLANKLKVNKATIYYHYKDKQSLYHQVIKNILIVQQDRMKALIEDQTIEASEKFKQFIDLFIQRLLHHPEIIPISLREMANFGVDIEDNIEDEFNEEIEYLVSILQTLPLKEKYKDIDPHLIKSIIMGTINTYYVIYMSNVKCNYKQEFNKNQEDIFTYLKTQISEILLDALCKI